MSFGPSSGPPMLPVLYNSHYQIVQNRDYVLTERFTLIGPDTILYRFTVEDPRAFTRPFTGEVPIHRMPAVIYEYACHEGNYALPGILAAAREVEKNGGVSEPPEDD